MSQSADLGWILSREKLNFEEGRMSIQEIYRGNCEKDQADWVIAMEKGRWNLAEYRRTEVW